MMSIRYKCQLISLSILACFLLNENVSAQAQLVPAEQVIFYTQEWDGPRDDHGRPLVSDEILERMKHVGLEEAWSAIRSAGYNNKFEGDWHILRPDQVMVGRALTAAFMPLSPELNDRIVAQGREQGLLGGTNMWPIYMLKKGDVYVADGYGKIKEGTLVGNNLGSTIYANSGNGPVFYGSARDLGEFRTMDGFNAWVKGWHPTAINNMMLISINGPTRIGEAIVLPGDVVLATEGGVLFIPPHLAERAVISSEVERLTDTFRIERIREGVYQLGDMYGGATWSDAVENDFYGWVRSERTRLNRDNGVAFSTIDKVIETRSRNWRQW